MAFDDKFIEQYRNQLDDIKKEACEVIEWATENYKANSYVNTGKPLSSARSKANAAFRKFMDLDANDDLPAQPKVPQNNMILKLNALEKKLDITETVWRTALNQMIELNQSMKKSGIINTTSALLPEFPLKDLSELKRFEMVCQSFPDVIDDDLEKMFEYPKNRINEYLPITLSRVMTTECGAACSWTGHDGFNLKNTTLSKLLLSKLAFL